MCLMVCVSPYLRLDANASNNQSEWVNVMLCDMGLSQHICWHHRQQKTADFTREHMARWSKLRLLVKITGIVIIIIVDLFICWISFKLKIWKQTFVMNVNTQIHAATAQVPINICVSLRTTVNCYHLNTVGSCEEES